MKKKVSFSTPLKLYTFYLMVLWFCMNGMELARLLGTYAMKENQL